jgi:transcriptional regulator with XRE-family HTH domain
MKEESSKKINDYSISLGARIGQRVKDFRRHYGLTQEGLAEKLEVHPSYVGQLERGERQASLQTLEKLALAFRLSPFEFFHEEEELDKEGLKKRCLTLLDKCTSSQIRAFCELLTTFVYKRK